MIADPLTTPPIQRVEVHNLPEALNIIDKSNMRQVAALERNCNEIITQDLSKAISVCGEPMNYIRAIGANVFNFDARIFDYDF